MNVLALTRYGRLGASSRLRTLQFLPFLKNSGIDVAVYPLFDDEMLTNKYKNKRYGINLLIGAYISRLKIMFQRNKFDLIWIEKEALPWMPLWLEAVLLANIPYVLDYDDAIFHNYDRHQSWAVRSFLGQRIDCLMADARLIIVGNDYLAKRAQDAGAKWIEKLPTVIDIERYVIEPLCHHQSNDLRIVWIGSPITENYLELISEALQALALQHVFKLRVIGGNIKIDHVDVECFPWSEKSEVKLISDCDIGIMPLENSPWMHGKCGYKLVQYMGCSLPIVASPIGVNIEMVKNGINGFLAASSEAWVFALKQLLTNKILRQSMGVEGRKQVESEFCVQKVAPKLANLLLMAGT